MANFQELSNLVWNVADDVLRGLFKQHEYGDITLPLSKWTSVATEPELDLLSNILQTFNDTYQTDFTEEDKVDLDIIRQKIQQDQDLRLVVDGDNTDSNKRFKFDQVLDNILLEFVTNKLELYTKLSKPNVKSFLQDQLYNDYIVSKKAPH